MRYETFSTPSAIAPNVSTSFIVTWESICKYKAMGVVAVAHLEQKAHHCPGQRGMARIILHSIVTNCFEPVHPLHNLFHDISQDDNISVISLIFPSSFHTFSPFSLHQLKHILEYG